MSIRRTSTAGRVCTWVISRDELAKTMPVEVRCFGDQHLEEGNLEVIGFELDTSNFTCPKPLRSSFGAVRRCIDFNTTNIDANLVHCHTWYTHLGGILAKKNYGVPLVITVHSLEPLRPWKREQLAGGYDFSLWVEKTALEMADAIIAVSSETERDVERLFEGRFGAGACDPQWDRSGSISEGRFNCRAQAARY